MVNHHYGLKLQINGQLVPPSNISIQRPINPQAFFNHLVDLYNTRQFARENLHKGT